MMKKVLLLVLILAQGAILAEEPIDFSFSEQDLFSQESLSCLDFPTLDLPALDLPVMDEQKVVEPEQVDAEPAALHEQLSKDDPEKHVFYTSYLAKYYPKVFVIRDHFFSRMTPAQIAEAIGDIVHIFSEKPWFYFFDSSKAFKISGYWEYVVDQCSFINDFLKKARVNLVTREVFLTEKSGNLSRDGVNLGSVYGQKPGTPPAKSKNLFLYLRDQGYTSVFDFYALSFDYLIKLFNEGILLGDQGFDMVDHYYYELDFVVKKLFKSKYEPDYLEVMKTCKELMGIFKGKYQKDLDAAYDYSRQSGPGRFGGNF